MVSATFTGMIITGFESALAAQVVLTAFIPMLMDTGGNSGSQASVTIIRALSLGELEFADTPKVIWKEIRTAVLCGVALATLCFCKIMVVDRILLGNTDITTLTAFVVCFTMALTVLIAKMVGCTLPLAAKKVGFDPAVMASPFITPRGDGESFHHHHRGRALAAGLLRDRQRPAVLTEKTPVFGKTILDLSFDLWYSLTYLSDERFSFCALFVLYREAMPAGAQVNKIGGAELLLQAQE